LLQFTVKHYAGDVTYDARSFPFKNKDTLFTGLVLCMQVRRTFPSFVWEDIKISFFQESQNSFILSLFPEDVSDDKSAPSTAGFKIRQSAGFLVKVRFIERSKKEGKGLTYPNRGYPLAHLITSAASNPTTRNSRWTSTQGKNIF